MELWFSEFHTPDVKHSIRVQRHLYSQKTAYQQIDIYDTPEFGRVLTCGAVYGFLAGVVAFACSYLGERIPHWRLDEPEEETE